MLRTLLIAAFLTIVHVNGASILKPATDWSDGRIVGGEDAVIETYPYQISLLNKNQHNCGGSIISAYYVLTAAHCVVDRDIADLSVRSGSSFRDEGGQVRAVSRVISHEAYGFNDYGIPLNDIALIRVSEPFAFGDSCQPINLYEAGESIYAGSPAVVTGWGVTGGHKLAYQLQTVTIPIITRELCDLAYEDLGGLPEGQMCAAYYGVGGKDACQADSGGPLVIEGRLAGVVSWGNAICAQPKSPGVYMEVAHYRDWINRHANL